MRLIFFILTAFLLSSILLNAKEITLQGIIIDSQNGAPVPGATIRMADGSRGTYSNSRGEYRLRVEENTNLLIRSLGYESTNITAKSGNDNIDVKLKPSSVLLSGVKVVGDITVEEIIKRTIARKEENLEKIKTFSGLLYSKLSVEMDGSAFTSAESDGNSMTLGASIGEKAPEKFKMFVLETFARNFRDKEKEVSHTSILQRRQTKNIEPQDNMLAIGEFINFYDDEFNFLQVKLGSPVGEDALDNYDFELRGRTTLDDRYVYIIDIQPSSSLFPGFQGTIKIVEESYDLVEVDVSPAENTEIPFFEGLHINEKFEEFSRGIWFPSFLNVSAKLGVDVIKGLMDIKADINSTSIYSEVEINKALPDSIYKEDIPWIAVTETADSMKIDFWEKNSLREITPREMEMYQQVDSLVAKDSSDKEGNKSVSFDWMPDLDFNRSASVVLGLKGSLDFWKIDNNMVASFSFGQQEFIGYFDSKIYLPYTRLGGRIYSDYYTNRGFGRDRELDDIAAAALLHYDVFDYHKRDGFGLYLDTYRYWGFDLFGYVDFSRQYSMNKTTNKSLFSSKKWRDNPEITEGSFRDAHAKLSYEFGDASGFLGDFAFSADIEAHYGESEENALTYRYARGKLNIFMPLIPTGYNPISLDITALGGKGSDNLPLQQQFAMPTWEMFRETKDNFLSAPFGVFGGSEFFSFHGELDLTDIWWRAIGLPKFNGRGINLLLRASAGKYFGGDIVYKDYYLPINGKYVSTNGEFYSEIGFSLSRIPIYISNVAYLRFDAGWGIGPIGSGNFGSTVSVSLPF